MTSSGVIAYNGGADPARLDHRRGHAVLGFNLPASNDEHLNIRCIRWCDDRRNLLLALELFKQNIVILAMQLTAASLRLFVVPSKSFILSAACNKRNLNVEQFYNLLSYGSPMARCNLHR